MKRIIFYILTALLSTQMITACETLPHKTAPSPKPAQTQEPFKSPKQPRQVDALTRQKIHQLLSEQNYTGAIGLIQNEIHKGANEQALAKEYLQAANESISMAEILTNQGHCSKAAILLKTVQDSYPRSPELQQQVAATTPQIGEKIDLCTEQLMEEGLVAYRAGEFAAAIDIWTQVLEFNPQHKAAKDSIQTTERQLANIKALDKKE